MFFRDDKVSHWRNIADSAISVPLPDDVNLKARIVPRGPVEPTLTYFTLGSSKDEVLAVQGQPDNPFAAPPWRYGRSEVSFSQDGRSPGYDKVVRWKSSPENPLKARIIPNGPVDPVPEYFTVGSTGDEVLAVQGQPDSVHPYAGTDSWTYGPSSVSFKDGRVVRWKSYPYHAPLKARPH